MTDILLARLVVAWCACIAGNAVALDCGVFNFPSCSRSKTDPIQYAGEFQPVVGFGGFGGGDCEGSIRHTPVVLVHGNGDNAIGWDSPAAARTGRPQRPSVYDEFKARGYNDCELFGVTYLDETEQTHAQRNFHQPKKYEILWNFIESVKAFTQSPQVDIVGHSLGVSMALAALDYHTDHKPLAAWSSVRRVVNIAGGLRGLGACVQGLAVADTCMAESAGSAGSFYEFGLFPDIPVVWFPRNRWTAVQGEHSLRLAPQRHPEVVFYTITAGNQDDIHCPAAVPNLLFKCSSGPLFVPARNVRAQVDIGAAPRLARTSTPAVDPDTERVFPHDVGGIGHFGARNQAGPILWQMLATDCRGAGCKGGYVGDFRLAKP